MKKPYLLMPSFLLSLFALSGCGEAPATIRLYDADSRLVITSFDDQGSIKMATYRGSKTGDVPYCELSEYTYCVFAGFGQTKTKVNKVASGYQVQKEDDGTILFTVDPEKDIFTVENYDRWMGRMVLNNGIGPDIGSPENGDLGAVRPSEKSKIIGERKAEVYHASNYGIDFIEQDGKCYVPMTFLSNFAFRWLGSDILYNGFDFYLSTVVSGAIPVLSQSYYANDSRFMASEGVDAIAYDPVGEEAYRFAYPVTEGEKTIYRIISLNKDGSGALLKAPSPKEKGEVASFDGTTYAYQWQKQDDSLFVKTTASGTSLETGLPESVEQGTQKIPLKSGGLYATKQRSKELAFFNYSILRFQFENFYGIKDVAGITSFDGYAIKKGVKDGLLSLDAETYDKALATLLMRDIDDGHTRYGLPSIISGTYPSKGEDMAKEYAGPRYNGLIGKRKEYMEMRKSIVNPKDDKDVHETGLFIHNKTAVVRFDSFAAPGIFVSNTVDPSEIQTTDPALLFADGNVPLGFDAAFYRIGEASKKNKIENVVIDLTCNGGGSVMALPYLLAHFSDDPYLRFEDRNMGLIKEFHYKVDLNHDGTPGGKGDTYKGQYNFFVLTSDFSFSCANFTPGLSKELGVKVIGKKSGGGACAVSSFADACGSNYNFSSGQLCVLKDGDGYKHNDAGVPVDIELPSSSWYDLAKLDEFCSSHH